MQLPLLCPEDLSVTQPPVYEAFERAIQADEYQGFEVRNADGAFVGPWGVILQFPGLAAPLGRFIDLVQNLDGVSERARQVIILTIGGQYPGPASPQRGTEAHTAWLGVDGCARGGDAEIFS